jgi:hypothetical protein
MFFIIKKPISVGLNLGPFGNSGSRSCSYVAPIMEKLLIRGGRKNER